MKTLLQCYKSQRIIYPNGFWSKFSLPLWFMYMRAKELHQKVLLIIGFVWLIGCINDAADNEIYVPVKYKIVHAYSFLPNQGNVVGDRMYVVYQGQCELKMIVAPIGDFSSKGDSIIILEPVKYPDFNQ